MAQSSKIEWTEATWNPSTGCTKISSGCANCYAEKIAYRFAGIHGFPQRPHHFDVTLHTTRLEHPLKWKKPQMIFVNSMSDLFHEQIPTSFILKIIEIARKACWHTFQILTKRSERLFEIENIVEWPENVWLGVSVENSEYIDRINHLNCTSAKVKFISCEPLIGPISHLLLSDIDWVIVGGESGPFSRPISPVWVRDIRDQCDLQSVPFFFKQWGGTNKKKNGRKLDNKTYDELPAKIDHLSALV